MRWNGTTAALPSSGDVFVPGKPLTDIWAPAGLRWRDAIAAQVVGPLANPHLRFARKDRSWFDLDNLAYPVLAVTGCAACNSVWATVERREPEGVMIGEALPPTPPVGAFRLYIASPNIGSRVGRSIPPELADARPVGGDEPLALALQFDAADVAVGELSYEGPVKALVDDLTPLFGERMISGRLLAKDYRVKELRISRGHSTGRRGVTVRVWLLPRTE